MTVVPETATEAELREMYGPDADQIIAFREFLRRADRRRGAVLVLDQPWYDYAIGKISAAEALARRRR